MIIEPGFMDHWKVRELNRLSGSEKGPYWMVRLWGECQRRKSAYFENAVPAEIAGICGFEGEPEQLIDWLTRVRWLEKNGKGYVALGWEEHNASLISRWENGQKGGRPRKPTDNPGITYGKPTGNRSLTDRVDRVDKTISREESTLHPKQQIKEQTELLPPVAEKGASKARPKDWQELVSYVMGKEGLTEADARYVWNHWKGNGWTNGGKPIKDWKATVRSWKYAGTIFPSHKNQNK